jgi:hypothetical protein
LLPVLAMHLLVGIPSLLFAAISFRFNRPFVKKPEGPDEYGQAKSDSKCLLGGEAKAVHDVNPSVVGYSGVNAVLELTRLGRVAASGAPYITSWVKFFDK